jgi:hypothetical protein
MIMPPCRFPFAYPLHFLQIFQDYSQLQYFP